MTDWKKHGFGPGTDTCCRCKTDKEPSRHLSKWCRKCEADVRGRRVVTGGLDQTTAQKVTRRTRIIKGGK